MAPRQWFPGHTGRSPSSAWRRGAYLWGRREERVGHVPRGWGLRDPQRPGPSTHSCPHPALRLCYCWGWGSRGSVPTGRVHRAPWQARAGDGPGHTGWAPLPGTQLLSVPNYEGSVGTERRTGWSACGCDRQVDRQTARLGGVPGGTGPGGGDGLSFQPLPRLRFPRAEGRALSPPPLQARGLGTVSRLGASGAALQSDTNTPGFPEGQGPNTCSLALGERAGDRRLPLALSKSVRRGRGWPAEGHRGCWLGPSGQCAQQPESDRLSLRGSWGVSEGKRGLAPSAGEGVLGWQGTPRQARGAKEKQPGRAHGGRL